MKQDPEYRLNEEEVEELAVETDALFNALVDTAVNFAKERETVRLDVFGNAVSSFMAWSTGFIAQREDENPLDEFYKISAVTEKSLLLRHKEEIYNRLKQENMNPDA